MGPSASTAGEDRLEQDAGEGPCDDASDDDDHDGFHRAVRVDGAVCRGAPEAHGHEVLAVAVHDVVVDGADAGEASVHALQRRGPWLSRPGFVVEGEVGEPSLVGPDAGEADLPPQEPGARVGTRRVVPLPAGCTPVALDLHHEPAPHVQRIVLQPRHLEYEPAGECIPHPEHLAGLGVREAVTVEVPGRVRRTEARPYGLRTLALSLVRLHAAVAQELDVLGRDPRGLCRRCSLRWQEPVPVQVHGQVHGRARAQSQV